MHQILDKLAEEIRRGINENGVHILADDALKALFGLRNLSPTEEVLMTLNNFAKHFRFNMYLSPSLSFAIFRNAHAENQPETNGGKA